MAMETKTKQCPRCAEGVGAAADACRHCGHLFKGGEAWRRKLRNDRIVVLLLLVVLVLVGLGFGFDQANP